MSNPYDTPKAELTRRNKPFEFGDGIPFEFRRTLWVSWAILVFISLVSARLDLSKAGLLYAVTLLLNSLLQCAIAVLLMFYLRGTEVESRKPPYGKLQMTIWGMVWRSGLARLLSLLPMAAISFLLLGHAEQYTFPRILALIVIQAISLLITIWALFSKDRKGQLSWLLEIFRA